ncbi:hypothetical protein AAVH_12650 [Aphelenchoides avenae]|nr:hypothetical protein AAVH_12650 [Aphelenchus avenae]
MDDQYELINPPNAGAPPPPPPPVAPNPPPPPAAAGAGPDGADSTLLQTKTDLKSDVKIAADPSAMPEAQDFGQSAYTSPVPPVDSKSQKDNVVVTESKSLLSHQPPDASAV